ncbi:MAG: DEAD/DEAH box helicase [Bacillota bacterium]
MPITDSLLLQLRLDPRIGPNITYWQVLPSKEASLAPFPEGLHPELVRALTGCGITSLYSHQARALELVSRGQSVVITTPTASGKTLCYNLPVLDAILKDSSVRALYLFPTKALAQDQLDELNSLVSRLSRPVKVFTYDGDTPQDARKSVRLSGNIVLTNPDMLHTGILPHHTKWIRMFQSLKYVVIDELHQYRGVFGSHAANVFRRLRRVARFYGADPIFIMCSATISNPEELAATMAGRPVVTVGESGAPSGERHFVFYNPPVVNRELGIRKSCILEARNIAAKLAAEGAKTIVFARSRLATEVLLTYVKQALNKGVLPDRSVRGYRGGYLPRERREIEQGLRDGSVKLVVATNALELGIDIGGMDAAVMAGYPGTIASTWQQAGRAGRRSDCSVAVLVASSSPLDQYIVTHPEYFFGRNPEHALVNPNNPYILWNHVKCSAFELPFEKGETFDGVDVTAALTHLADQGILHEEGGRYYWMAESFPAEGISLRSASNENFVVVDITDASPRVVGEVDRASAPLLIHDDAIYIHEGQQYHVEKLDWEAKKAYVKRVDVDYYTDANLAVDLRVIHVNATSQNSSYGWGWGSVSIVATATVFKKVKLYTHENVGSGSITLPEEQMHTDAFWLTISDEVSQSMEPAQLQSGLQAIANLVANAAPLFVMCDPKDLGVVPQIKSPFSGKTTLFVYESYPGGTGLSQKLYELQRTVLETALRMVESCRCSAGCPSCVGPAEEVGQEGKRAAKAILEALLADGAQ